MLESREALRELCVHILHVHAERCEHMHVHRDAIMAQLHSHTQKKTVFVPSLSTNIYMFLKLIKRT